MRNRTRLFLRQVHLVLSLAAGLWLAASGLTGSLLVFGDAVDRTMHPELFVVRGDGRLPLDAIVAAAQRVSRGRVTRIRLAGSQTPVHEVWIHCDDCRRVWVDPSTARVNGIRSAHGTTRTMLHELHRRLLFRGAGDVAVLIGGVALFVVAITGIVLGWRGGLRMRRANNYELHRVLGLIASPFLLVAAGTGVYFIAAGLKSASRAEPVFAPAIGIELALQRARVEFPSAEATWISFAQGEVIVRFRQEAEAHPNGRTFVRVAAGNAISKTDALAAPPSKRMLDNLYPLHIGATGGRLHRAALVGIGGTPAILMITGVLMWLRRRSRRVRYTPATETFSNTSVGVRCEE